MNEQQIEKEIQGDSEMKDGGSVFPVMPPIEGIGAGYGYGYPERGLMLRDHIALEVLKELIKKYSITCRPSFEKDLAEQAYKFADTMLEVRG